jgi:catechol 2,3-dioxygenase-like lactoylglutathione lyase family enzyme
MFGRKINSTVKEELLMELGAFSVSLSVKDINASKAFYEKLGFTIFAGELSQNWLIMRSGLHVIGLFQGMFPTNTLTFNPGWDNNAQPVSTFSDIRELQRHFKAQGLEIINEADEASQGPASFMLMDPDGNPILFDQHV